MDPPRPGEGYAALRTLGPCLAGFPFCGSSVTPMVGKRDRSAAVSQRSVTGWVLAVVNVPTETRSWCPRQAVVRDPLRHPAHRGPLTG
jgi:hypothetical protein